MNQLDGDEVDAPEKARRWGIWYWKVIGDGASTYMRRLNILTTPWFSIKLHWIYRPDNQRALHDHPWSFLSFVLWGDYVEDVPDPECPGYRVPRWIRWFNWKRAEDRHAISFVSASPIITLVISGPTRRVWGFWTKESDLSGWVRHDQYEVEA